MKFTKAVYDSTVYVNTGNDWRPKTPSDNTFETNHNHEPFPNTDTPAFVDLTICCG